MAEQDTPAADIETMSFEQAMGELEQIVQRLERGQLDLADAIEAYERGNRLRAHCETKLNAARLRVQAINAGEEGPELVEASGFERT